MYVFKNNLIGISVYTKINVNISKLDTLVSYITHTYVFSL